MIVDVVVDLQYGDCGKGKVTHSLLSSGEYTHCVRYNGGHNAGHTIIHNGQKIITHIVPAGVLYGVKSIIGPGCVVSLEKLEKEIRDLETVGIENVRSLLFVDKRTNVITPNHLNEDGSGSGVGSTKMGNGPAYRDKYARNGVRIERCWEQLRQMGVGVVDVYEELHNNTDIVPIVLMEGAQGFGLDVDWGDYPYVTSSHCTTAGAMLNGIPPKAIRNVYGVCKAYETYVGTKPFQPIGSDGDIYNQIGDVGGEYGATTGRRRQVNFLDLDLFEKAIKINGVTHVIMNKMDVLKEVHCWKALYRNFSTPTVFQDMYDFVSETYFKDHIESVVKKLGAEIQFSYSPEDI